MKTTNIFAALLALSLALSLTGALIGSMALFHGAALICIPCMIAAITTA